jgi:hypothetical protein
MPTPTPLHREIAHFTCAEPASAIRRCDFYSRDLLAGGWGEGGEKCETMPFVNRSSDQLQTQTKIANTILLLCYLDKICLSPFGGLWQASANLYCEQSL